MTGAPVLPPAQEGEGEVALSREQKKTAHQADVRWQPIVSWRVPKTFLYGAPLAVLAIGGCHGERQTSGIIRTCPRSDSAWVILGAFAGPN
jgi:hypothetical protein